MNDLQFFVSQFANKQQAAELSAKVNQLSDVDADRISAQLLFWVCNKEQLKMSSELCVTWSITFDIAEPRSKNAPLTGFDGWIKRLVLEINALWDGLAYAYNVTRSKELARTIVYLSIFRCAAKEGCQLYDAACDFWAGCKHYKLSGARRELNSWFDHLSTLL